MRLGRFDSKAARRQTYLVEGLACLCGDDIRLRFELLFISLGISIVNHLVRREGAKSQKRRCTLGGG
jgi:hypothetical protein